MSTPSPPPPPLPTLPPRKKYLRPRSLVESVALGAAYGVLLRILISAPKWSNANTRGAVSIMTAAFLVLGPIVIGFLTIRHTEAHQPSPVWIWICLPWASVSLMMGITALFALEGLICIAMALPVAMVCASLGGIIAGVISRRRRVNTTSALCLAVLPLLLAPAEMLLHAPLQT
ncbi:MAG: hypothetical protein M3O31_03490, partial [Acidobacteriota bacterium]|nr:hypothetical protein [Acidobacteriota bacterium]